MVFISTIRYAASEYWNGCSLENQAIFQWGNFGKRLERRMKLRENPQLRS
jgi:hypothetical protein